MSEAEREEAEGEVAVREGTAGSIVRELLSTANARGAEGMLFLSERLDEVAEHLLERGREAEQQGDEDARARLDAGAARLQDAAHYLRASDPQAMLAAVDRAVARHPYRAMVAGGLVGWCVGRWARR